MSLAQRCGYASAERATERATEPATEPATERDAAVQALLQRLDDDGIEQLRIVWCDLHGAWRGKTLVCSPGQPAVQAALADGVGLVSTVLLKDTSDHTAFKVFEPGALQGLPGFAAANNVLLLPDPASYQRLPWASGTAWLRAEPFWPDGQAVAVDTRGVLQRALERLAEKGYGLRCGLEVEFHVYRISSPMPGPEAAPWPADVPALQLVHPGFMLLGDSHADLADEVFSVVRRTALGLGLPLRSLEIELGPSQVEAVFGATDALTAADQMVLFRNAVRQALRRAGYHASFACRPPFDGAIASGWHLHQSLVALNSSDGCNAMARLEAPVGDALDARQLLSDPGALWLAGLLAHAQGMAVLAAPTISAYSRFKGSLMAPQAAVWGRDNRGAMLRVVGELGQTDTRVENRLGEPMANPYLYIASQVLAGLDGLARGVQPPPACEAPYGQPGAPTSTDLPALPASLGEALDALAADSVISQGLGPPLLQLLLAVKRQELARFAAASNATEWLRREYFARF